MHAKIVKYKDLDSNMKIKIANWIGLILFWPSIKCGKKVIARWGTQGMWILLEWRQQLPGLQRQRGGIKSFLLQHSLHIRTLYLFTSFVTYVTDEKGEPPTMLHRTDRDDVGLYQDSINIKTLVLKLQ